MHQQIVDLEQQIALLQTLVTQLKAADSVTGIDKDLLKQKCVELYGQILNLPIAIAPEPQLSPLMTEIPAIEPPQQQEPIPDSILLLNDVPPMEDSIMEQEDLFTPLVSKTETEIRNEEIEQILEDEKTKEPEEWVMPLTKEESQEISLHEKIAYTLPLKPDLSEKLAESRVASLKSAINVNLKIAIVNDLFNENTVEYVKAIDKLNNFENIHEAMRYFTELKHTYDWDNQNDLVRELESLINKRFQ